VTGVKRFFAQHLEGTGPTGENRTAYFDSFEEACEASDAELVTYSDPSVRSSMRQEITDTAADVTWVRVGDGPWSLTNQRP